MNAPIRVLVVEDNPPDADAVIESLSAERDPAYWVECAERMAPALELLAGGRFDVALLDLHLPDSSGLDTIARAMAQSPGTPFVVLTGYGDRAMGLKAVQSGAQDYLVKGEMNYRSLPRVLQFAIERRRLERLKEDFIGIVSHEIRTPLTIINACAQNLAECRFGDLTAKQQDQVAMLSRNGEFLSRVVNNMLAIARLESGKVRIRAAAVDFGDLMTRIVRTFAAEIASRRIRIERDLSSAAPPAADPDMIEQVMANLIGNALRHARTKICITARDAADRRVQISVEDDGSGIPAKDLELLFGKFVQLKHPADGRTRTYKGTGLGLAICKEIVELHGGKIWAESAEGTGARFSFVLPATPAADYSEKELMSC